MSRNTTTSLLLIAPLFALILVGFLLPIGVSMLKAFENPEVSTALPRTVTALESWDRDGLPDEPVFAALVADLTADRDGRTFGAMTRRLNFEQNGMRGLMTSTRRDAGELSPPFSRSLPALDPAWGDPQTWGLIKTHSNTWTASYILRSLDWQNTPDGGVTSVEADQAIFLQLFARTFEISLWVTALSVVFGYPTAWFLSTLSGRVASFAMLCVLVPFWTSILVRSTAWFILLQREGPINALLLATGLAAEPQAIIFTRPAVYIAMVHVMLPFFILPLYSVMKRIRPEYVRAAASLGAPPWRQFTNVYLPMTMPGVAAGGLMVFMLSVGFYVTPALVGGLQDQMVSYYIAFFTNTSMNLGMAAALSLLLLAFTGILVVIASRAVPGFSSRIKA